MLEANSRAKQMLFLKASRHYFFTVVKGERALQIAHSTFDEKGSSFFKCSALK